MTARRNDLLFAVMTFFNVSLLATGCAEMRLVDTFDDTLIADGIDTIDLSLEDGDLTVVGRDDQDSIDVTVDLMTNRQSEDKDADARHDLRFELRDMGDGTALLTVNDPAAARYFAHVTVTMPADLDLIVDDGDGDVGIELCGALDLKDGAGDVDIVGASGGVVIDDGSGDLALENVIGNVEIEDGSGDLDVSTVEGDATIDDGAGDMLISDVTGTVTINDGSGDIEISNAGTVEIENSGSGSLTIN